MIHVQVYASNSLYSHKKSNLAGWLKKGKHLEKWTSLSFLEDNWNDWSDNCSQSWFMEIVLVTSWLMLKCTSSETFGINLTRILFLSWRLVYCNVSHLLCLAGQYQAAMLNWFLSPQTQWFSFNICWQTNRKHEFFGIVGPSLHYPPQSAHWAHVRTWLDLPFHFTCHTANCCHIGGFTSFGHGMLLRGYLYNLPLLIPRLSHIGRNIQD